MKVKLWLAGENNNKTDALRKLFFDELRVSKCLFLLYLNFQKWPICRFCNTTFKESRPNSGSCRQPLLIGGTMKNDWQQEILALHY
jgi:hypothetical protein